MSLAKVRMGSERGFGFVFAGVFIVVAFFPLLGGGPVRPWALGIAGIFAGIAAFRPALLAPLNRVWFRFSLAVGNVMTPLVMGLIFVIVVIPTALLMKLLRKDPMQRRFARGTDSYWERREQQPGPMREQF
jgi:hypothetical protein